MCFHAFAYNYLRPRYSNYLNEIVYFKNKMIEYNANKLIFKEKNRSSVADFFVEKFFKFAILKSRMLLILMKKE